MGQRRGVVRVGAGDGLEHERGIVDGPRQRSGRILAGDQRYDAMPADPADGRLEAHEGGVDGRRLDRILRLRADRECAESRAERRRRAHARSQAAAVAQAQRMAHDAAGAAEFGGHRIGHEVGELGEVGLAEQDGARLAQAGDERRFVRRHEVRQRERAGRGGAAVRREHVVLHEIRHTVQWAAPPSRRQLRVGMAGRVQGQRRHATDAVQAVRAAVLAFDAVQIPSGHVDGRYVAGGDRGADHPRRCRLEEGGESRHVRVPNRCVASILEGAPHVFPEAPQGPADRRLHRAVRAGGLRRRQRCLPRDDGERSARVSESGPESRADADAHAQAGPRAAAAHRPRAAAGHCAGAGLQRVPRDPHGQQAALARVEPCGHGARRRRRVRVERRLPHPRAAVGLPGRPTARAAGFHRSRQRLQLRDAHARRFRRHAHRNQRRESLHAGAVLRPVGPAVERDVRGRTARQADVLRRRQGNGGALHGRPGDDRTGRAPRNRRRDGRAALAGAALGLEHERPVTPARAVSRRRRPCRGAGVPFVVRRQAEDEGFDEADQRRQDQGQQDPERIRRVSKAVHEAGRGNAADVQQADAVDAALQVETVDAEAAEQEGEGGSESLVLVLRHRIYVERKAISMVQKQSPIERAIIVGFLRPAYFWKYYGRYSFSSWWCQEAPVLQHRCNRLAQSPRRPFHRAHRLLQPDGFGQRSRPERHRRPPVVLARRGRTAVAGCCSPGCHAKGCCLIQQRFYGLTDSAAHPTSAPAQAVPDDLIQVGHITGAYGIRGGVRVTPYSMDADALLSVKTWWIDKPSLRTVQVRNAKYHSGDVTATLVDVTDRRSARQGDRHDAQWRAVHPAHHARARSERRSRREGAGAAGAVRGPVLGRDPARARAGLVEPVDLESARFHDRPPPHRGRSPVRRRSRHGDAGQAARSDDSCGEAAPDRHGLARAARRVHVAAGQTADARTRDGLEERVRPRRAVRPLRSGGPAFAGPRRRRGNLARRFRTVRRGTPRDGADGCRGAAVARRAGRRYLRGRRQFRQRPAGFAALYASGSVRRRGRAARADGWEPRRDHEVAPPAHAGGDREETARSAGQGAQRRSADEGRRAVSRNLGKGRGIKVGA
ncbi:hypothetical protein Lal_00014868 [Lupinus albus]|nr:hypothetical protein Lal_00014868 [Lupinus albus]